MWPKLGLGLGCSLMAACMLHPFLSCTTQAPTLFHPPSCFFPAQNSPCVSQFGWCRNSLPGWSGLQCWRKCLHQHCVRNPGTDVLYGTFAIAMDRCKWLALTEAWELDCSVNLVVYKRSVSCIQCCPLSYYCLYLELCLHCCPDSKEAIKLADTCRMCLLHEF